MSGKRAYALLLKTKLKEFQSKTGFFAQERDVVITTCCYYTSRLVHFIEKFTVIFGLTQLFKQELDAVRSAHGGQDFAHDPHLGEDRKSTRLNSSHSQISYAV